MAREITGLLVEATGRAEGLVVRVEPDLGQAHGYHVPGTKGVALVPQKGLRESAELDAQFDQPHGAPLAYLYLYRVTPVIGDKRVDLSQLPAVTIEREDDAHEVHLLVLTVKRAAADDYRLYGYGKQPQPVVDTAFHAEESPAQTTVALTIVDANQQAQQATLRINVFGKYQAGFRVSMAQ
jgi:hypothetical protein